MPFMADFPAGLLNWPSATGEQNRFKEDEPT
jgi:hypothetical protein